MNVDFLKDVALAVAQEQHLETVMKAIKESALQGLWIGRPFVHQPAKDCCGTHRNHGKWEYNNQRKPISWMK